MFARAYALDYTYRANYGLELGWKTDERVGITTGISQYGEMEQLTFWASSKAMASRNDRSLYAAGYQLKTGTVYYSYAPFKWSESFDAKNIKCNYANQSQTGNGNANGLATVDYQMAMAVASATEASFSYRHIGGILRISFPAPTELNDATLSIETQQSVIATSATMDIVDGTTQLGSYDHSIELSAKGLDVGEGKQVVLYLACPAQDLSTRELDIIIANEGGTEHTVARIMGPDIKAGMLYDIAIDKSTRSRVATKTMTQTMPITTATGVANPIAHTDDILLDNTFVLRYTDITTGVNAKCYDNKKETSYTLGGVKTIKGKKGEIYIQNGKKYKH